MYGIKKVRSGTFVKKAHGESLKFQSYETASKVARDWNNRGDWTPEYVVQEINPEDDSCPMESSGPYNQPDVQYCPSCGGEVEDLDTPIGYRCLKSGKRFYVEV